MCVLDYSLYLVVTLPSRMVRLLLAWFSLNNSNVPNILGRIFTQWYSGQHYLKCERKGHNVQVALRPYSRSWLIMKLLHSCTTTYTTKNPHILKKEDSLICTLPSGWQLELHFVRSSWWFANQRAICISL